MTMPTGSPRGRLFLCVTLAAMIGADSRRAAGQGGVPDAKEPDARARRLEEMAALARTIKVATVDREGNETPVDRTDEPLHRWTDPTREFSDGGMWVWRSGGRPVAVVGIELYAWWSLEFVSLSPGLVRGNFEPSRVHWKPQSAGVEFREIDDAPAPGSNETVRFRQMRELAARFSGREVWEGNRNYALRLLPRPVDRYSAPASGTIDGGVFIFANGTNPEILMMIEARQSGDAPAKWSFAAAPLSHCEVRLKLGTKIAWSSPSKDSGPRIVPSDPYYDVLVRPGLVSIPAPDSAPKASRP